MTDKYYLSYARQYYNNYYTFLGYKMAQMPSIKFLKNF